MAVCQQPYWTNEISLDYVTLQNQSLTSSSASSESWSLKILIQLYCQDKQDWSRAKGNARGSLLGTVSRPLIRGRRPSSSHPKIYEYAVTFFPLLLTQEASTCTHHGTQTFRQWWLLQMQVCCRRITRRSKTCPLFVLDKGETVCLIITHHQRCN